MDLPAKITDCDQLPNEHWRDLCRRDPAYRAKWLAGEGPGHPVGAPALAEALRSYILTSRRQRWGSPGLSFDQAAALMGARPWPAIVESLKVCYLCPKQQEDGCERFGLTCEGRTRWRESITRAPCPEADAVRRGIEAARAAQAAAAGCGRDRPPARTRFVTIAELQADTMALIARLPATITQVVALARSGMIPGSILATMLHLPLWSSTPGGYQDLGTTYRLKAPPDAAPHILLIDDTAYGGKAMRSHAAAVRQRWPDAQLTRAVIYCAPSAQRWVDLYSRALPKPHYLEWHLFSSPHANAAMDFDGVFCHDIAPDDDDDGPRYERALRTAKPRYLPRYCRVPLVVTARLDRPRYRELTVDWLSRHRIAVDRLEMGPWKSLAERNRPGQVPRWKAHHYQQSGLPLFVESCAQQAQAIARITSKPVLCPDAGQVY